MEAIEGRLERVTYENPESGYSVLQLKEPRKKSLTCVVGNLKGVQPGETLSILGEWQQHKVHGLQFVAKEWKQKAPSDLIGIEKYLSSGLIKGIGPKFAKKIVTQFGLETLDVIDQDPKRLFEIEGVGKKRVELIVQKWQEQRKIRDVMVFLQGHGISPALAQKIYKRYGNLSIDILQENPYRLARDLFGVGFLGADKIARNLGFAKDSTDRIAAGITYVLNELSSQGHVCYPLLPFLEKAQEMLEVPSQLIEQEIDALKLGEKIFIEKIGATPHIYSSFLYFAEKGIAKRVKNLLHASSHLREILVDKAIPWVEKRLNISLAQEQTKAVTHALTEKMLIITGGPGTGKSTITNAILEITKQLTRQILCVAPTGRAAKRMQEITGFVATTIHAKLEVDFARGGFKRDEENPLECDLLICDEASMIDTHLMYHLLKAIPDHARVIFVGDIFQLPSVGPGNVLKDLITSNQVPTVTLNEIFRQAKGSRIITNSHLINQGSFPDIAPTSNSDFFFIHKKEPSEILTTILDLVVYRLPKKYNFDPLEEIQVLAPMRKGTIGIENINQALQKKLNPQAQKDPLIRSGRQFLVGDKVMQIRNNYKKEVFNGDIGRIRSIDIMDSVVAIQFDQRIVDYDFFELEEIVLAYAVSIHKYQGSETPCVVIPLHTSHFKMLHRNLLYTGVTRGKKLVILVGAAKALAISVHNCEVLERHTGLEQALSEKFLYLP